MLDTWSAGSPWENRCQIRDYLHLYDIWWDRGKGRHNVAGYEREDEAQSKRLGKGLYLVKIWGISCGPYAR